MAVALKGDTTFEAGVARPLFNTGMTPHRGRGQKSLRREPRRQALSVHDAGGRRPFVAVYSDRQLETRDVPVTIGGGVIRVFAVGDNLTRSARSEFR